MSEVKFYRQKDSDAILAAVTGSVEGLEEIVAGSVDAAAEKHVPVVTVEDGKVIVRVGEVAHPMLDVHYIEWIAFADGTKLAFKYLKPGDAPEVFFAGEHGTVYAHCNLHGLWKAEF
ncbi:MAG: iron-binding protein [Atopobiaceae bacterium]|nr:iron-binding protein [Atopobiaceae bacterium]